MSRFPDKIVPIIGTDYLAPIKKLMEELFSRKRQPAYKIQAGFPENGYSVSIILLWVAMLESFTVRLRYLHGSNIHGKKHPLDVIQSLCPRIKNGKALEEVFVVRDLIFHNHLWEFEYDSGTHPPLILRSAIRDLNYGNKRFLDRVNLMTLRTKALRLNINPIRIDRYDVLKVARVIGNTLRRFHNKDHNICQSFEYGFRQGSESLSLQEYL